jgi:DNA-binding MarR family transcriptional regulator
MIGMSEKTHMGEALKKRILQEHFEGPAVEAMLNLLVAADYMAQKADEICSEFGISRGQFNVLRILKGVHPDGHPRCEIMRRMLERAPDVTRLVDRLEAQGLAVRDRSKEDRRLSITRITPAGIALLVRMTPRMKEMGDHFAERVSRRDCRELSRICEGLYGEDS